jgi:prepilin-type N-terminal cleavage/methylation domain-containing protein
MNREPHRQISRRGFSLIELVIVVVIIGIIAAIAVPRMSRGAKGAANSAVAANLAVLRNALDLYATEHLGDYPAIDDVAGALTTYTDISGDVSSTSDSTHVYGPYVRTIPPLPVGTNQGRDDFTATPPAVSVATAGWYYNATTGQVLANTTDAEVDDAGVAYNTY